MIVQILVVFLSVILLVAFSDSVSNERNSTSPNDPEKLSHKLPVVFVYTVVPQSCGNGLPSYIRTSIEQSIFSQPDCDVILLSNIGDCPIIAESVKDVKNLEVVDSLPIATQRTANFQNISLSLFNADYSVALWITSALRFFMMEDLMLARNYSELLHIEADNMMYGRITTILPILRSSYPLAATPLNCMQTFITASVFWIAQLDHLVHFNDYLLALGHNTNTTRDQYIDWLRPYARKPGGAYPDANGEGVKPFAINEMSMLAYYHLAHPTRLKLLPIVPAHTYNLNKYVCNMSLFGPEGGKVGPSTGHGIWDANSWGQYLGGTSSKKGRDKGFTDASHVSGQAIRMSQCRVEMVCANISEFQYGFDHHIQLLHSLATHPKPHHTHHTHHKHSANQHSLRGAQEGGVGAGGGDSGKAGMRRLSAGNDTLAISSPGTNSTHSSVSLFGLQGRCYSAPFVKCGEDVHWTPLWNLHVHSKHTQDFRSELCACPSLSS